MPPGQGTPRAARRGAHGRLSRDLRDAERAPCGRRPLEAGEDRERRGRPRKGPPAERRVRAICPRRPRARPPRAGRRSRAPRTPGHGPGGGLRPLGAGDRVASHGPRRAWAGRRCKGARREHPARRVLCGGHARRDGEAAVSLVPVYRPRASPLHTARASVAACFCCAFALVGGLYAHPVVLGAALVALLMAGAAAGVGREVGRSLRLALPLALLIAVVNPIVYQGGDTLLVRGGVVLGRRVDITLEALVAGSLAGLRVIVLVVALGLLSAAVDPDELLRLFRRISYRSALTASLATRLVPVLARDASRMSDAARCRAEPPGRLAVARAALSGALERAVDVAAALEVRGYASAGRVVPARRPWSRHDLRLAAAACAVLAGAIAARAAGVGGVDAYPRLELSLDPAEAALAALLVAAATFPFAGRAARLGVARG